jgi:plastocyanin
MIDPFWDVANITRPRTSADWAPSSFSPMTGLFYVTASVRARAYAVQSAQIVNGEMVVTRPGGGIATIGSKETGTLTALDPRTNTIAWQKQMPYPIGVGSGVLSTAGNLVFHGEPDGNVLALDARTGDELWRFQTGFGADAPVVTYELDGVQYVAIATGGTSLARSARGDGVWSFRLDGPLLPLNPPPAPINVIGFFGPLVATSDVSIGKAIQGDQRLPSEFDFAPQRVRVAVGDTVTWTNEGAVPHTATDQGASWDTGLIDPGASVSITFDQAGVFATSASRIPGWSRSLRSAKYAACVAHSLGPGPRQGARRRPSRAPASQEASRGTVDRHQRHRKRHATGKASRQ